MAETVQTLISSASFMRETGRQTNQQHTGQAKRRCQIAALDTVANVEVLLTSVTCLSSCTYRTIASITAGSICTTLVNTFRVRGMK
jgi:hypothetical protein